MERDSGKMSNKQKDGPQGTCQLSIVNCQFNKRFCHE